MPSDPLAPSSVKVTPAVDLWTALIVAGAALYSVILPIDLVLAEGSPPWLTAALWGITAVFALDVVVRLRTPEEPALPGRRSHGRLLMITDLVAAVPVSFFRGVVGPGLPGLAKLTRVGWSMHRSRTSSLRHSGALVLAFASYWLLLAVHWLASGWIALRGGSTRGTWVADYVDALYWTVTTVTTVGYGDVTPTGTAQRLYAIVTMVAGLAFFGYLIGIMASILGRRDPARVAYEENIDRLSLAVRYGGLPPALQQRIHEYYTYMWLQRLGYDESDFLESLPVGLHEEVALHIKSDVIENVELFVGAPSDFVAYVALRLRPEVFTPGDWIFREGDEGSRMYFIVRGEVEVFQDRREDVLDRLGAGDFFGEISLFFEVPRTASVKAVTYCDVYFLSKASFQSVIQRFPKQVKGIESKALARHRRTAPGDVEDPR